MLVELSRISRVHSIGTHRSGNNVTNICCVVIPEALNMPAFSRRDTFVTFTDRGIECPLMNIRGEGVVDGPREPLNYAVWRVRECTIDQANSAYVLSLRCDDVVRPQVEDRSPLSVFGMPSSNDYVTEVSNERHINVPPPPETDKSLSDILSIIRDRAPKTAEIDVVIDGVQDRLDVTLLASDELRIQAEPMDIKIPLYELVQFLVTDEVKTGVDSDAPTDIQTRRRVITD